METSELKGKDTADLSAVQENVEDVLFDSLETLFDLKPINFGSVGSLFHYRYHGIPGSGQYPSITIALQTPDTLSANWELHASAIWVSAIYLADNISRLDLPNHPHHTSLRVLELGASAGLPGILTAKLFPGATVTASDYPDERLIKTLSGNVVLNDVERNCQTVAHKWGSDVSDLLNGEVGFDVILAADTLWNGGLHDLFIDTLVNSLTRCPHARVYIVAGLHTGRYTIRAFLRKAEAAGLEAETVTEYEVDGAIVRDWDAQREGEDDKERRRWVVWAPLKWHFSGGSHGEQLCNYEEFD